jgi:hypothetical protein
MFTGNIQKGGAMLDDTRRLLEVWDDESDAASNLDRITSANLLGKTSRKRSDDVLLRILGPRFVEPGTTIIPALRTLQSEPRAFREACYYETARDDLLLAAFAEGPLFAWYTAGRVGVSVDEVKSWLQSLSVAEKLPELTDIVQTKVARGLLAALRDFGVLKGAVRKEFDKPGMTAKGFAYVVFREHDRGVSARALVESPIWHRWLLDERWVSDLLHQVDRLGVIHYSHAGSAIRIDWRAKTLQEVVDVSA